MFNNLKSIPRSALPALLVAAAACFTGEARAQSAGSTGMFGGRSLGSSFSPAASSFTGAGRRGSGMQSGFGGAMGMGGGVAGMTQQGDTSTGQITGSERYLRGARQPGQFVGSDSSDTRNFMSQMGAISALSQMSRAAAEASNPNRQSGMSRGSSRTVQPRVETTIGFEYPSTAPAFTNTLLQSRFAASPRFRKIGSIAVRVEGRTVVLSGVVPTEHDRALAAQVALLEAGVSAVRNELQIAPPPAAGAPVAAPPAATPPMTNRPVETQAP